MPSLWLEGNRIRTRTPYDPALPPRFREIRGTWHPSDRTWSFPLQAFPHLPHALFPREEVHALCRFLRERVVGAWHRAEAWREDGLLLPEQAEDLRLVWRAFARFLLRGGPKGFLLANGTGTGKTYLYSAFAAMAQDLVYRPLVVVPNEDIARQAREVLALFGAGARLTTYARLNPKEADETTLLILDEAHLAKRLGSGGSKRAEAALHAGFRSAFVLYVSATPFDKPWEIGYILRPTGLHRHLGYADVDAFLREFKVYTRANPGGGKEYYFAGGVEDLKRFHDALARAGFTCKRLFTAPVPVEYEVPVLEGIGAEEKRLLAEVRRRLKEAARGASPEDRGLVMAHRTLLSRAMLERMKLRAAFGLLRSLLEEGWYVLLFLQYRGERELDLSTEEGLEALWEEAEARGNKVLHTYLLPALAGLTLRFPSPTAMIREAFADLGEALAFYTGAETEAVLRGVKARWDRGEVRLLVATAAKGGTGLSLHDTTGERPTAQVVLTLPWTATQLDQILGRTVRVGMKSPVRVVLPAAPVPFERRLAKTIAYSLHTLGHAVRGGVEVVPRRVVEAFLHDLAAVDPGLFARLMQEEEALAP